MQLLSALVVAAAVVTGEGTRENLRGLIAAGLEASTAGRAGAGRRTWGCKDDKNKGREGDKCWWGCSCDLDNEFVCMLNFKCTKVDIVGVGEGQ
jgi:hypothetical protein